MQDLSEVHGPIRPRDNTDLSRYELTPEQLKQFETDGFVAGVPVLSKDEVEELRQAIAEVSDPDHEGREFWYEYDSPTSEGVVQGGFLHGSGAWRVRPAVHDLLWNPAITVPLRQILGRSVRLLHDGLFSKPANQGGTVSWHQDYSYWTYSQPMAHATCWIAFDDATVENGCVHYIPGSHQWDVLLPRAHGPNQGLDHLFAHLTPEQQAAFTPVAAEVPAGSAIFHHPLILHGSQPNRSPRPRRAYTMHVMADGTRAVVDLPEIDGVPAWLAGGAGEFYPLTDEPAGPVLGGRFFPVMI